MDRLREIRQKAAVYQEIYYLIFILIMGGSASAGLTSEMKIYQILFVVAAFFWLIKMITTDFTWKEILIIGVVFFMLGLNFLGNREKTLIISCMAIFGVKNVSFEKVFKYSLWVKVVLTIGVMSAAALGIIENHMMNLPKNGERVDIYCYGYLQPNSVFSNIFTILLLVILLYGDKLKWYMYVGMSVLIAGAYKLVMCRTGLIVWILLCLMVFGFRVTRQWRLGKIYRSLMVAMPLVIAMISFLLPVLCRNNEVLNQKANYYLTGRVSIINHYMSDMGVLILGHVPRQGIDSMYFNTFYNYGAIIFIVWLFAYTAAMWYSNREEKYYDTIALAAMAVYGFMELFPLSIVWNLSLLFLSRLIFKEETQCIKKRKK